MSFARFVPVIALMIVGLTLIGVLGYEQFVSGGTLVQLATSHVPTPQELEDLECYGGLYNCVYRRIPFGF